MTNIIPLRTMRHITIRHLDADRTLFATAGFIGPDSTWPWISETIARELECSPDDVHVLETEAGDMITVDGLPCFELC